MPTQSRVFFRSLEALRGIAALIVVIYHVGWINPFYDIEFVRNGALMVDLFFVLSGFVMVHCYRGTFITKGNLFSFLASRFWRLYPLHLLMLLFFLLIEFAKYIAELKFGISSGKPAFSQSNGESFFYQLFLLHSLVMEHGSFNSPSWSISTEFYTYITFAFLMLIVAKQTYQNFIFILISVLSLFLIIKMGHSSLTFDYEDSIFRCLYGFFLGAFTYGIYNKLSYRVLIIKNKQIETLLLIVIVASLFYVLGIKHDNYIEFLMPPLTGGCILLLTLSPNNIINRVLCLKPFLWLGKVSYSIYMIHLAFIWGLSALAQTVMGISKVTDVNGDLVLSTTTLEGSIMLFILILFVLSASHFSHKYIEIRFKRYMTKNK